MKKGLLLLLSICVSAMSFSQSRDDFERYIEEVGDNALLNNGTVPVVYTGLNDGHCYIYSPEFIMGDVKYAGRVYYDVLLNINAHLDQLYMKHPVTGNLSVLAKGKVEFFNIGEREYVNFNRDEMVGFYEVMIGGDLTLYKRVSKEYYQEIVDRILYRGFKNAAISYLLEYNGKLYNIKKLSDIYRLFPTKKKEIKSYLAVEEISFKSDPDRCLMTVLELVLR